MLPDAIGLDESSAINDVLCHSSVALVLPHRRRYTRLVGSLACLTPWPRNRFDAHLAGAGQSHVYMVYVRAGWAIARLRRRPGRLLARMDPLLKWLAIDGLAFHEAYFQPRRSVEEQVIPKQLT